MDENEMIYSSQNNAIKYSRIRLIINKITLLKKLYLSVKFSARKGLIRRFYFWAKSGHIIKKYKIKTWIFSKENRFLQLGGGNHFIKSDGWMNGDIIGGDIYLNAAKKFLIPDNCIDFIFTEQFFEHLDQYEGYKMLRECFRVLKPGGVLRQSTPDLQQIINVYQDNNKHVTQKEALHRHMNNHRYASPYARSTPCQFINDIFRLWGHKFIYDRDTLETITRDAGFKNCQWEQFGESSIKELRNRERHADEEWMKNAFVMILEAQKLN